MSEREELERELGRLIALRMESPNFLEDFRRKLERKPGAKSLIGKKEGIYNLSDLIEVQHPVLRRKEFLNPGDLSKEIAKEVKGIFDDLKGSISSEDKESLKGNVDLAERLLNSVRRTTISYLLKVIVEKGDDIRPLMMPGSVGRGEVPNLYMGEESYSQEDRIKLALQLAKSIGIGDSISVYFEGDFHEFLRDMVREKFSKFYLDASDLKAGFLEIKEPFVALLRLLIWIYEEILEEEELEKKEKLLEKLKESSGIVYFVPEESERYTAFHFPQLSRFVEIWLKEGSRREALKSMLNSLKVVSWHDESIKNKVELIYRYLNLLARSLIESCAVDWEPLRRISDILLDLFDKNDVKADFSFIRRLISA